MADDALVDPHPGVDPLSTTVTCHPRRVSSRAIEQPMIPAPTTTAEDGRAAVNAGSWGERVERPVPSHQK
jgi:hypothetical protein